MTTRTRSRARQHEGTEAVGVSLKNPNQGEVEEKNVVRKVPVDNLQDIQNPARVRVEASTTSNLGNYESVRVSVAIEMPCAPNEKAINKTYAYLSQRVECMVRDEEDAYKGKEYQGA